jgi:uncharacterized protein (DUF58 family)
MPIKELRVELEPKLNNIQVNSRRDILSTTLQGEWSSFLKGKGIEFSGFRQYQYGDDASLIDWKASLRAKEIIIREFEEFKNFTVFFLLDVSDSMLFSSHDKLKCEYGAELLYVLAEGMNKAGDSVGMAMFNDEFVAKVQPYIGMEVMNNIKSNLIDGSKYGGGFDIKRALLMTKSFLQGRAVIIIISDFLGMEEGWEQYIRSLSDEFELIAFMIKDPRDREIPADIGQLMIKDPYTGENIYIDTGKLSKKYKADVISREKYIQQVFKQSRGDFLLLKTDNKNYTTDVLRFFHNRAKKNE